MSADPTHGELEQRKQVAEILGNNIIAFKKAARDSANGIKETSPGMKPHIDAVMTLLLAAHHAGEVEGGKRELEAMPILETYEEQYKYIHARLASLQPHGKEE